MRKFLIIIICIMVSGCSSSLRENDTSIIKEPGDFNEKEVRDVLKKDKIKNNKIYYANDNYKESTSEKFTMYNSLEESIASETDKAEYGYPKQKIKSLVHTFEYKNGVTEVHFISKGKNDNKEYLYEKLLYKNDDKYSYVFNSLEPILLDEKITIERYTSKEYLLMTKLDNIQLPVENEPNKVKGITTDNKVRTMKIEGKTPDGIKEFKANGIKYYFWYYDDLKSDKEVDKYTIQYDGYTNTNK